MQSDTEERGRKEFVVKEKTEEGKNVGEGLKTSTTAKETGHMSTYKWGIDPRSGGYEDISGEKDSRSSQQEDKGTVQSNRL